MTPERKREIKHKLRCADIWDDSKMELHKMLLEAMIHIEKLEEKLKNKEEDFNARLRS